MLENSPIGHLCSRLKVILLTTVIVFFFPIIGTAFYISAGLDWLRRRFPWRSVRAGGFLFACAYAAIAAVAACRLFPEHLLPRFNDIFLLGILLTVYRFTWRPAALLLAVALVVSASAQAPLSGMASFVVVSVFSIAAVARLQTGHIPAKEKAATLLRLQQVAGAGMGG